MHLSGSLDTVATNHMAFNLDLLITNTATKIYHRRCICLMVTFQWSHTLEIVLFLLQAPYQMSSRISSLRVKEIDKLDDGLYMLTNKMANNRKMKDQMKDQFTSLAASNSEVVKLDNCQIGQ